MRTSEQTIGGFLDALAAKQSTPGGGGAAALTGSQAAGLLSMVINFTLGNKKYADVQSEMELFLKESESLRQELLSLADEDETAFEAVSACYGMPRKTEEEKAARTAALQDALLEAARVPFVTAERSLAVMQMVQPVAEKGNTNVVSDAGVALYLGHAALQAALINVNINLKFIKDSAFVQDYSERRDRLVAAANAALAEGKAACQTQLGFAL